MPSSVEPIVSVVIPARDAAGFLPAALRSAQDQTLQDLEILVVDDGSRDSTWPLLTGFAAEDRRIRPLRRAVAGGPAAARNLAFRQARGRWIALLDADDLFLPDRLGRLVPLAERLNADLLADDLLRVDFDTGLPLGRHFGAAAASMKPIGLAEILRRDRPGAPDAPPRAIGYAQPLIRRDLLRRHAIGYDENLPASEDLAFLFDCVAAGARFMLAAEAYYVYRLRTGSVSRRPGLAAAQAAANRRIAHVAISLGDREAASLAAERQDVLDGMAVAEAALDGRWLGALSQARWRWPRRLATDLRVVAGAARRRIVA
ncbi:glycosyltransferase family 2 protein [Falsiroseomonas sp. HW251]|uniref:glycosyltransferase family 2 protein n=1 Tax=Falsiroseomonas sp. HW251 TaxID=3390998 RepID=UPI003D320502